MRAAVLAVLGVVLSIASPVLADAAQRDPAQEAALDSALRALAPSTLDAFHAGNAAMDRRDYAGAAAAYGKVHEAAPSFVAGTRRLCTAEARSGKGADAVRHCREALAAEGSAENHAALAVALLNYPAERGALDQARREADEAVKLAPNAEYTQLTLCEVAYEMADIAALDRCSGKLDALDPSAATTHFFAAVTRLGHRDPAAARDELEKAKATGLDPRLYETLLGRIRGMEQLMTPTTTQRVLAGVQWLLAGWAAGLVLLFGLGGALSLRVERRQGASAGLRRLYAGVVTLATLYFYLSLAVLVLSSAAALGAFAYMALPLGQATFLKAVVVAAMLVYAALAIARAATTYDDDQPLGVSVSLQDESKLKALLDEVASAVGTRPVDAVYVVEGAGVEVADRDGALAHLRGRSERALVLGFEWLGDRKLGSLRTRLAGELGQWRREGAAGGPTALAMRRAIRLGLVENESAINPARWLLRGWSAFYERVTRGAVSEQERLVRGWVDGAYGDEAGERDDDELPGRTLVGDRAALEKLLRKQKPVVERLKRKPARKDEDEDEDEDAEATS